MKIHDGHTLLLTGTWFSLLALVIGGSMLLPVVTIPAENSLALLYKFAQNDPVVSTQPMLNTGRVIVADLASMRLFLYEEGSPVNSFPILSKGRPGTPWETPVGRYTIQAMELKHFSTIGGTWMPYSMQFYGNFFIHGWPTYINGEDVSVGYSGGCIRLATNDARQVYDFSSRGVTVFVQSTESRSSFATSSRYYLRGTGNPPQISANSFIVGDIDTGEVLWGKGENVESNPRGLTLLMSSLTALETVNQYKLVRMSELLMGSGVLRKYAIGAADEVPSGSLVYPLIFDGSDTAAKVFAREHGEKQFLKYMNEKSAAIGMESTRYGGPLSTNESTTTVRDLMLLLQYINNYKHYLIDVSLAKSQTLTDADGKVRYTWTNNNPWIISSDVEYRGGLAVIDGQNHGDAMILFDFSLTEFGPRKLAVILLDSKDVLGDVAKIRQFVNMHFVYGIQRENVEFVREEREPILGLLQRAVMLLHLDGLLQDEITYEREI